MPGQPNVAGDMYRLVFKTSDKLGAGTDATVRVELRDDKGNKWQPVFAQVSVLCYRALQPVVCACNK